jgi:2-oxo-4-hydroxy-4-carboxy-5-ureidoimidazoline decarboxylase
MNPVLARWNTLDADSAAAAILPCCGSNAWATTLAAKRPIADEKSLIEISSTIWRSLPEPAWHEAFNSHPRIGQKHAQSHATAESLRWSAQEQRAALSPNQSEAEAVKLALAEANRRYEQKFNRIFIVCATGKTAPEILRILEARLHNDATTELHEAAEQQRQITQLRLRRWLEST